METCFDAGSGALVMLLPKLPLRDGNWSDGLHVASAEGRLPKLPLRDGNFISLLMREIPEEPSETSSKGWKQPSS